jgi:hypothetical protein
MDRGRQRGHELPARLRLACQGKADLCGAEIVVHVPSVPHCDAGPHPDERIVNHVRFFAPTPRNLAASTCGTLAFEE